MKKEGSDLKIMEEGHISVITLRSGKGFTAWYIEENAVI